MTRRSTGLDNYSDLHSGRSPQHWEHVFASVQSIARLDLSAWPADHFDILVIDEFHHAEAATYRRLIDALQPKELLGLTATPERADGLDVRDRYFAGRTAYELRLWDALSAGMLSPFQYFGLSDGTDLRGIDWHRGRYDDAQLSDLFTGNTQRSRTVLREIEDKVTDPSRMRAVAFCVSVDHAHYMSRVFADYGLKAAAVTGATPLPVRSQAIRNLADGTLNVLCVVDILNEGVDIPAIDTVLFLRPTESATLFLQQLGRGLRLHPGKEVLTVLDFVGNQRREFRFDQRLTALTGVRRGDLVREVEKQFPTMPSGSQIVLDEQTRDSVLQSLRLVTRFSGRAIVAELRRHLTDDMADFATRADVDVSELVTKGRSWTSLRREAGAVVPNGGPREEELLRRVRALAHVDDPDRLNAYGRILTGGVRSLAELGEAERTLAQMLLFSLWPDGGNFASLDDGFAALIGERNVRHDMKQMLDIAWADARRVTHPIVDLPGTPLRVHASYRREEVLLALGYSSLQRKPNSLRQGVLFAERPGVDAFFITLRKSEADYSPTTLYRDYAISQELFHWESQSVITPESRTGRRYVQHREMGTHVLLFVRESKSNEFGTAPYVCLGTAQYVSHRGSRPMQIVWRLDVPMPAELYATAAAVAV